MDNPKTAQLETAVIVPDDATFEVGAQVPDGLEVIGHVVHWHDTPSFTELAALMEPTSEVKPAQFMGVWHGRRNRDVLTVVQVANSFEVDPNEVPELAAAREALGLGRGYGGEGVSTRIFRLAQCTTLEEFDVVQTGQTWEVTGEGRAPEILTRAGDPVVLLPPEITIQAIGGLPSPQDGLHVGVTYGSSAVPVTLVPQVFQLHTGIFGNPGRGKSYLSGNLLEEAVAWGIPALVLDINGE